MAKYYGNELYHFGIKGQEWGVRRYQNEDGTLTEAGKRRYGTVENFKNSKDYSKIKEKDRATIQKSIMKSKQNNIHEMDEKINSELRNTKEYKDYKELNEKRPVITIRDGKGNIVQQYRSYMDSPSAEETVDRIIADMAIEDAYESKSTELGKKYALEMNGAALRDIGESDTEWGREYLAELFD